VPPTELRAKVSVFANLFLRAEELAARARQVQESADQLRLLTDTAPIGIFQTDADNRYIYTNPLWSAITGIASGDAVGKKWDIILGPDDRAVLAAARTAGRDDATELSQRFQVEGPGGMPSVVLVTSRPMPDGDGDGIAGWVGTLADVTAEAGAEAAMAAARDEATAASQLKSDFLANMSHEIRTPMNGIIGMTDLLLETGLDPCQRDYAQTVRNSSEALLAILNDILDFSRIEAGRLLIEEVEFSLRDTVGDVVDLLAGPAQAKGLELVAVVEQSVPAVIVGDPGRVRQVLTNLVGNAIKFTQAGEVVVRVKATDFDGAEAVLRVEVSDTGDGIAADKLGIVFQPFVQGDSSTSRKYGGTGLGLSISGQLVALMGGDCGVSSTLGAGSEFWFTVSVRTAAGMRQVEAPGPDADLAGVTALIVDDSAAQRRVLSGYLAGWGMKVATAASGAEALAAMREAVSEDLPFAVALLDRFMPGMDGLELKDAIVADPALTSRLVLVTGLGRDGRHDSTERSGISASLSKPVHPENLQECLRVALGLGPAWNASLDAPDRVRSATGSPKRGRILLAEDNLINQKVAVAMLSGVGYIVDVVNDGAAALEAVAAQRYDAILMDCQMPVVNGYEATIAIRAQEGTGRHTPIIALTASARREDRDRCLAVGMDSYLAKPVSKDALVALVASWAKRELTVAGTAPISLPG
jgi:two-component system sensor histidine kinase/response regulator